MANNARYPKEVESLLSSERLRRKNSKRSTWAYYYSYYPVYSQLYLPSNPSAELQEQTDRLTQRSVHKYSSGISWPDNLSLGVLQLIRIFEQFDFNFCFVYTYPQFKKRPRFCHDTGFSTHSLPRPFRLDMTNTRSQGTPVRIDITGGIGDIKFDLVDPKNEQIFLRADLSNVMEHYKSAILPNLTENALTKFINDHCVSIDYSDFAVWRQEITELFDYYRSALEKEFANVQDRKMQYYVIDKYMGQKLVQPLSHSQYAKRLEKAKKRIEASGESIEQQLDEFDLNKKTNDTNNLKSGMDRFEKRSAKQSQKDKDYLAQQHDQRAPTKLARRAIFETNKAPLSKKRHQYEKKFVDKRRAKEKKRNQKIRFELTNQ